MKKPKDSAAHFFVDESGDPTFFNARGECIVGAPGCSKVLIVGFIETGDPSSIRRPVLDLHAEVMGDPLLTLIPSTLRHTAVAFHAKNDAPEVRYRMFSLLRTLDFKAQFIVARKVEQQFRDRHRCDGDRFYDDVVTHLFKNVLHRFKSNEIVFAKRGSRGEDKQLKKAIWHAKMIFEQRHKVSRDVTGFRIQSQWANQEPCLSVIDYMNWAVHRAFELGDKRHYDGVSHKVSFIRDVNEGSRLYCRKKPYKLLKVDPLGARLTE